MNLRARRIAALILITCSLMASACAELINGNENGSDPINDSESTEYKKAIVRCYKTGGTRVVKIMGELRCY